MNEAVMVLLRRAALHDKSKLEEPELSIFAEYAGRLKGLTYMSDEYRQCLKEMAPALEHHYAANRHHPQHFPNGIDDMNLFDLLEMFIDWYASTKRHDDGDINDSIDKNKTRFELSDQLERILRNTIVEFDPSVEGDS